MGFATNFGNPSLGRLYALGVNETTYNTYESGTPLVAADAFEFLEFTWEGGNEEITKDDSRNGTLGDDSKKTGRKSSITASVTAYIRPVSTSVAPDIHPLIAASLGGLSGYTQPSSDHLYNWTTGTQPQTVQMLYQEPTKAFRFLGGSVTGASLELNGSDWAKISLNIEFATVRRVMPSTVASGGGGATFVINEPYALDVDSVVAFYVGTGDVGATPNEDDTVGFLVTGVDAAGITITTSPVTPALTVGWYCLPYQLASTLAGSPIPQGLGSVKHDTNTYDNILSMKISWETMQTTFNDAHGSTAPHDYVREARRTVDVEIEYRDKVNHTKMGADTWTPDGSSVALEWIQGSTAGVRLLVALPAVVFQGAHPDLGDGAASVWKMTGFALDSAGNDSLSIKLY